ncbi:MAG TPA: STAS/SEC14 domain-containing protein [Flavobacteriaceae bacterium]|nr:STAS/SEC14 domain-containing protein [Flavobacteriaceae bacterium]
MIQILEQTQGNIIATKATGKLTQTDYDKLLPLLNDKLGKYPKIRWYFEMEDFEGWDPKAFWEDVKFDFKHAADFDKVAMVGEKKWEEWMADLMKPFTAAEVKYFDAVQREEAIKWIKKP